MYGEEVVPEARFDKVINKMMDRMIRLQKRGVSLMGRVLFSNSLLASCLWFFMYFIIPTEEQLVKFDRVIWGMLWGKPGDTGTIGRVRRPMVTQPRSKGLNVMVPSIMAEGLQANVMDQASRQLVDSLFCVGA